jgi:dihydroflavonol-4-reductase
VLVLVTGASGFIGSSLCRALAQEGHRVRAFHRPTSNLLCLDGVPVEHALGDILDPTTLRAAVDGVEVVYHTAAEMGAWTDPLANRRSHISGTRNVLDACRAAGVRRFVHTSSVAALGLPDQVPGGWLPIDETHPWNLPEGRWRYGYAKYQVELEVVREASQGLDAVIVNPSAVFGAGDLYRASSGIIPLMARGAWLPGVVGGLNVVHIDDVVAGHLAAARHGRRGERYILGGENLSIARLLAITAEVVGRKPSHLILPAALVRAASGAARRLEGWLRLPIGGELLTLAGHDFFYDLSKARSELGLPMPKPFWLAAEQALAWYREHGLL